MEIELRTDKVLDKKQLVDLYASNEWSSAKKPDLLYKALLNSHTLVTAYADGVLVGLGSAISDGYLVVYYPHFIVHPDYQGNGIGKMILDKMQEKYGDFHMQSLTADGKAIDFYKKNGFERAGETEPMWIYEGDEH